VAIVVWLYTCTSGDQRWPHEWDATEVIEQHGWLVASGRPGSIDIVLYGTARESSLFSVYEICRVLLAMWA
jgi:hypothetical protein